MFTLYPPSRVTTHLTSMEVVSRGGYIILSILLYTFSKYDIDPSEQDFKVKGNNFKVKGQKVNMTIECTGPMLDCYALTI